MEIQSTTCSALWWNMGGSRQEYEDRRILGDVRLTYEEFSTLLYQIESCLNSRPLVPLNNDEDAGHFLIGRRNPRCLSSSQSSRDGSCVSHCSGIFGSDGMLHIFPDSQSGSFHQETFKLEIWLWSEKIHQSPTNGLWPEYIPERTKGYESLPLKASTSDL